MDDAHYPSLTGPHEVRNVLDDVARQAQLGNSKALEYDWKNLGLWLPEHRWACNDKHTCYKVWQEMTLVASKVLKDEL